jgi:hypothetical protein
MPYRYNANKINRFLRRPAPPAGAKILELQPGTIAHDGPGPLYLSPLDLAALRPAGVLVASGAIRAQSCNSNACIRHSGARVLAASPDSITPAEGYGEGGNLRAVRNFPVRRRRGSEPPAPSLSSQGIAKVFI